MITCRLFLVVLLLGVRVRSEPGGVEGDGEHFSGIGFGGGIGAGYGPIEQHSTVYHQAPAAPQVKVVQVPVDKPYPVYVPHQTPFKVPIAVPVYQKYPVKVEIPITKTQHVEVERPIPITVEKKVPYHVNKPYQVVVNKYVPVYVPKPFPVHVPVYKHVYHGGHH